MGQMCPNPKKVYEMQRAFLYVILVFALFFARPGLAEELKIAADGGSQTYTINQLKSDFPIKQISTISTWTDDETIQYEGVSLKVLLEQHKLLGTEIEIAAENGYVSKIPREMIETFDPIIAFEANGEPLDFSSRGPLSLIWPRSDHPEKLGETIDGMWTWYVSEIRAFN